MAIVLEYKIYSNNIITTYTLNTIKVVVVIASFPLTTILYGSAYWKVSK